MEIKKRPTITIGVLLIIGLSVGMIVAYFIFRRRAERMMEDLIGNWKTGEIGSVGEDFQGLPEELLVKMRPESTDPELQELMDLYEYKDKGGETDEEGEFQFLSDEEYQELMETQYPNSFEAGKAEAAKESEDESSEKDTSYIDNSDIHYGQEILDTVVSKIEVGYKLPFFITYPLNAEITVTSPSVEDAYLSVGKDCSSAEETKDAMVDYIKNGKAKIITETREIQFYKSDGQLYAEPEEHIANALTGGYADFMVQMLSSMDGEENNE